jgi:KDO2-lipid IV(A) lauroyltransferase
MLYFILRLFSSLPLVMLQGIGATIGLLTYFSSSRYRKRLNQNHHSAATFSGFTPAPWKVAAESGMMFADTLWIWQHPKSSIEKVMVANLEQIISLAKNGNGLIILASHLGGFEIVPRFFAAHIKATVMYRPAKKSWVNELMLKSRQHPQMEFVEANLGGVRKIKRAIKNGEVIGIMADQVPSMGDGVWAKFFNQYAYTTKFPIKLTRKNKVATLFVSAERLSFGRGWEIQHRMMSGGYPKCPVKAATLMNQFFEASILSKPNQYMWSYNRYKRPHGAELAPII